MMKILKSYSSIAKNLFIEQDDMDKKIKYKTKDGKEKEVTVGGALKQGEKHCWISVNHPLDLQFLAGFLPTQY